MIEIRKADLKDVPFITACSKEAFEDYIAIIGKEPEPMILDYNEIIQKDHAFVACEGENLAGYVTLKDGVEKYMWLDILAVSKAFKGRGIGGKLIAFAENYMREQGMKESRLYTHVKYEHIQAIYKHYGYEIYDRVQEKGYDRYYMKKTL